MLRLQFHKFNASIIEWFCIIKRETLENKTTQSLKVAIEMLTLSMWDFKIVTDEQSNWFKQKSINGNPMIIELDMLHRFSFYPPSWWYNETSPYQDASLSGQIFVQYLLYKLFVYFSPPQTLFLSLPNFAFGIFDWNFSITDEYFPI